MTGEKLKELFDQASASLGVSKAVATVPEQKAVVKLWLQGRINGLETNIEQVKTQKDELDGWMRDL